MNSINDFVNIKDGTLFFEIKGSGSPILLLAGGPGFNPDYMQPVFEHLAQSNQVILLHQRGTGKSVLNVYDNTTVTFDKCVEDIETVRKHLNIDTWTVLGHSWGGLPAAKYAIDYPNSVNKLILSNSGGLSFRVFTYLFDIVLSRLSGADYVKAVSLLQALPTSPNPIQDTINLLKTIQPAYFFNKQKAEVFSQALDEYFITLPTYNLMLADVIGNGLDFSAKCSGFDKPVTIIHGREDVIDAYIIMDILKHLPHAQLHVLEQCGHYPWLDKEDEFFKILLQA